MNFLQVLLTSRVAPPRPVPAHTLATVSYQVGHDLARGLDPAQERARRAEEKAKLEVRFRPYTLQGRAAYDAQQAAPQPATPPTRHVSYGAHPVLPLIDLDFTPALQVATPAPAEEPQVAQVDAQDSLPDHLLDEAAARLDDEDLAAFEPEEASLSAAELNEPALLNRLRGELRGAVARAANRALSGAA